MKWSTSALSLGERTNPLQKPFPSKLNAIRCSLLQNCTEVSHAKQNLNSENETGGFPWQPAVTGPGSATNAI